MLDRIPTSTKEKHSAPGLTNLSATIKWLVSRQLKYLDEDEEEEEEEEKEVPKSVFAGVDDEEPPTRDGSSLEGNPFVGFNGRCNKRADTCYSFWVTASLAVSVIDSISTQDLANGDRCLVTLTW